MKIENCYNEDYTFVDVRAPIEFKEDHIPGAINIPLLSDEERAIVGTLYKKEGKENAIDKGLEFISPKLPEMINKYKKLKNIIIYCFRGGMRSNSIASLLNSMDIEVEVLERGYKEYRKFVMEKLEKVKINNLHILYGLTGSGKTEILNQLPNSLDLEGCAQHRGSIFGDINLEPKSQKFFESLLLIRITELKDEKLIFTEGESRKIGKVQIPLAIWKEMQKAKKIKVVNTIEQRVDRIYKEYCNKIDIDLFCSKLDMIVKYLGNKKVAELKELLKENKLKEFIKIILLEYYDKLYAHTIDSKEYEFEINDKKELLSHLP
jgi:tRNA 2-selenouridine synthase